MARIAFFHNALGKTDGVSLEVDKWRTCLEQLGHEVLYCAGNSDATGVYCIPELSFFHPETRSILNNAVTRLENWSESELQERIARHTQVIKKKLLEYLAAEKPDVLVPNNLMSVGYHLPAMIAMSEIIQETGLPAICHNHDFWFETSGEVHPTCPSVRRMLEQYAPPAFPNVQNLVINRLAQQALMNRKGIESRVVPNVFDFDQPAWEPDDYSRDFRASLDIGANDIVILQATRIMDRKGVELAIDVTAELARRRKELEGRLYDGRTFGRSDKIILLCAGHIEEFGASGDYHAKLGAHAEEQGVDMRFVEHRVGHSRKIEQGTKIYSLWDSYAAADLVTYPSQWEGWGNQLIEAFFAKLPVVLFEYPVFISDLKDAGFDVISLGDAVQGRDARGLVRVAPAMLQHAAAESLELLRNNDRRRRVVENNYAIGRQRYSFEVLKNILVELLKNADV